MAGTIAGRHLRACTAKQVFVVVPTEVRPVVVVAAVMLVQELDGDLRARCVR
ncbi:MAG: hypothetical protein Q8K58_16460 [Acidimicrobiales bacterium]|nr:hypothetical protein [Acidimicrobiales bacterium]